MKESISENMGLIKTHRSYSPEEVFAAGGTTAFALKHGKTREALIKALQDAQPIEPFTQEEWVDSMAQLAKDK